MHKLGILGLGAASTAFYIEQLNLQYGKIFGNETTCPFVLVNTDFAQINQNLPNNFKILKGILSPYLHYFEKIEIDCLLIPNITLHETIDMLISEHDFSFKIIHPITLAINHLQKHSIRNVTILGSHYTMTADYMPRYLREGNININHLPTATQKSIDEIRKKIFYNNEQLREELMSYINNINISSKPIIACTELSQTLISTENLVDLAQLQIKEAINIITT